MLFLLSPHLFMPYSVFPPLEVCHILVARCHDLHAYARNNKGFVASQQMLVSHFRSLEMETQLHWKIASSALAK